MDEAGQHEAGVFPTYVVEKLERLVAEVDDVPSVYVDPVGRRREDHIGYFTLGDAQIDCSSKAALGPLIVAHLYESAEPFLEHLGSRLARWEWIDQEPRRSSGALRRHVPYPLVQGEGAVLGREVAKHVG